MIHWTENHTEQCFTALKKWGQWGSSLHLINTVNLKTSPTVSGGLQHTAQTAGCVVGKGMVWGLYFFAFIFTPCVTLSPSLSSPVTASLSAQVWTLLLQNDTQVNICFLSFFLFHPWHASSDLELQCMQPNTCYSVSMCVDENTSLL